MKRILLFSFLLFHLFPQCLFASGGASPLIDSLLTVLGKAKEDTAKVNLLNNLSYHFQFADPNEGLKFADQAIALAQKLSWKQGMADAAKFKGANYFRKSAYGEAFTMFNSCLKQYEAINDRKGIAKSLGNIGNIYLMQADYPKALKYYLDEVKILEQVDEKAELAGIMGNIGIIYFNINDYEKSLDYYTRSITINRELGNTAGVALTLGNVGGIYAAKKNYGKALDCYDESLKIFDELGNRNGVARNYSNKAIVYRSRGEYAKAIDYYEQALAICKEIGNRHGAAVNYNNIGNVYLSMVLDSNKAELNLQFKGNQKACLKMALAYVDSGLMIKKELGDLNLFMSGYTVKSEVLTAMGDYNGALENYKTYIMCKDSIFNIEKDKKLTQTAMQYEFDKKEAATQAEQEKKDIRQRNIRNSISLGFVGALLFGVVVYRQRNKISKARKRSDELLLNILPQEVADELKAKGHADARQFDEVTVLFTDFKGFTAISEQLTPKELVQDLHECFTAFDNIIRKHGLEKIKTIGDSYMAVSGLPSPVPDHALNAVNAAMDILEFIDQLKAKKNAGHQPFFEVRIGLHSGSVVAGIVGVKKFAYDIWGDTVNIASRLESSGEAGKINISETTHRRVKEHFHCRPRGKIDVKGKGELEMYFIE
jgi:class 3 adenylate cyclase/uncharacterized protein HemY